MKTYVSIFLTILFTVLGALLFSAFTFKGDKGSNNIEKPDGIAVNKVHGEFAGEDKTTLATPQALGDYGIQDPILLMTEER